MNRLRGRLATRLGVIGLWLAFVLFVAVMFGLALRNAAETLGEVMDLF